MQNTARFLTHNLRRWQTPILVLAVALCTVLYCSGTFAQSGAGSIEGTITDATGAVIPGASIHVVNKATGVATSTKSNRVGFYQVPDLFTGTYSVAVTTPGMKTYTRSIDLLVAQNAVINPVMTAGAVTQQIKVTANPVQLITTDDGTIGSVLDNKEINQLPMNTRLLGSLIFEVTPGLENSGYGGTGSRANGLEGEGLDYIADGVTLTDRQFGGMNQNQGQEPDPDAVQEVRVETTDPTAKIATPGAVLITTKSGTNSLHGTFFETARNNAWGIAKARQNPANFAAPHLVRNEFGASAGGPIILPKLYHGKNKSFWFFAYERYSLSQASNAPMSVTTAAMRNGDFSGLILSSGVQLTLYDPQTTTYNPAGGSKGSWPRETFTQEYGEGAGNPSVCSGHTNCIPSTREAPAAKILNDITPLPTSTDDPFVTSNLAASNPNFNTVPSITFRLDHVFNENNRVYLRYTGNQLKSFGLRGTGNPLSIAADGFPADASGLAYSPTTTYATALGYTHIFSPTFFGETILSQEWFAQHNFAGGNPLLDYEKMMGLPNNFGEEGFPGFSGLTGELATTQYIYGLSQIVSTIDENLTKIVGRHQLQFGGRYRHERFGNLPSEYNDGIAFHSEATALENPASGASYSATSNTGDGNSDLFLGAASAYTLSLSAPYTHFGDMELDAYFQDNFHVNKNLTLNLGLRYEAHPAPWTKDGVQTGFDFTNSALVLPHPTSYYVSKGYTTQAMISNLENDGVVFETAAQAGFPSAMFDNFNSNFEPRIGIAYQPFGGRHGTVIRGAYGRYIYPMAIRNAAITDTGVPFAASSAYTQNYTAANQSPDGLPNYLMRSTQSVVMGTNSSNVVDSSSTNAILPGTAIEPFVMNPNYPPDIITETNFTVEQELKGNSALRLSWIWTHGTNLDHDYYFNSAPSPFVWEMETGTTVPTGSVIGSNQYAATALGPFNQTTYGNITYGTKTGWSNYNALQASYQRLFHHGIAYQINYVWAKPLRMGGNSSRDSQVDPAADYLGALGTLSTMTSPYGTVISPYLPPARPAGVAPYYEWHDLAKYEENIIDTAMPKQHIKFTGIVDLPFGKGKRIFGNANRFLDEIIGGFQVAGDGSIVSQDFVVNGGNWGPTNPLHVYKHGMPITDCRSGVCHKSYEWFNGYIAPTTISGNVCAGSLTNVISGLPSSWAPSQSPIDTTCSAPVGGKTIIDKYYGDNEVNVNLPGNPTPQPETFSPGPYGANPYSHTVLNGPINWTADASLFKVFPVTERVNLRFNMDAFNLFNVQGYNNPSTTDGTEAVASNGVSSSANTPRQIQFTLRVTF
ncbi:MAG: carboxypeptidase regulatory-like domain-containing protein [Terriglobia bacterium]